MNHVKLPSAEIAYLDEGEGIPILMIHGFASNAKTNWLNPGWINFMSDEGYRVIALDNRGHGESTKFYEQDDYKLEHMAGDVANLIDHLELGKVHIMGYSMGARISSVLAHLYPEKVDKVILAGNGNNMIEGGFDSSEIYNGLMADSDDDVTTKIGTEFRAFAKQTGSDLKALAACIMGGRSHIDKAVFTEMKPQVLVTVGTEDSVAVDGDKLASIIPNGQFKPIPKRNHMNAVGDKVYKQNVLEFLKT